MHHILWLPEVARSRCKFLFSVLGSRVNEVADNTKERDLKQWSPAPSNLSFELNLDFTLFN